MIMFGEPWKIERNSAYGGLYDVYNVDGNIVTQMKVYEIANVIAAAPELLTACKWALEALGCDRRREDRLEAQRVIHAAVKKAEGKS